MFYIKNNNNKYLLELDRYVLAFLTCQIVVMLCIVEWLWSDSRNQLHHTSNSVHLSQCNWDSHAWPNTLENLLSLNRPKTEINVFLNFLRCLTNKRIISFEISNTPIEMKKNHTNKLQHFNTPHAHKSKCPNYALFVVLLDVRFVVRRNAQVCTVLNIMQDAFFRFYIQTRYTQVFFSSLQHLNVDVICIFTYSKVL